MTDTRYSAEELRKIATYCEQKATATSKPWCGNAAPMLRQAAADAETLAGIRKAITDWQGGTKNGSGSKREAAEVAVIQATLGAVLAELDRLSRGDA